MDEENPILKHWLKQEKTFEDNLLASRKRPTKDSVHDLRVAIKRMRSYLRLKKQINKEEWKEPFAKISILFKSFGRLRDFDMSLTLLRKHEHKELLSFPFFKQYLAVNRSLTRKWAKQDAIRFDEKELEPPKQQFNSLQVQLPGIDERIILLSRKKLKRVKELEDQFKTNAHEIRKLLKDVYYWIQICPKELSENFIDQKALDKMLNNLGSWQDNFILTEKIKRYKKDLAKDEEKKSLKDLEEKLELENRDLLDKAEKKWAEVTKQKRRLTKSPQSAPDGS